MTIPLNENRSRWYGLRVGDTVRFDHPFGPVVGIVASLNRWDNNSAFVTVEGEDKPVKVVCEWCTIIERVDDAEG